MRGNIKWQVNEILKEIKAIGKSKHEAKNQAREGGARGSNEIAKKTELYGIKTIDSYREICINFGNYAKKNGINDITKTTAEIAQSYLQSRIDENYAHKTFQLEKAALNKFETALNRYSESHKLNKIYDFKLNETFNRQVQKDMSHADVRAYNQKNIDKILNIKDKAVNLACRIALNAGLRKSEILNLGLKHESLKDNNTINVIGGKGGKNRTVSVIANKSLIKELKTFLTENNLRKFGDAVSGEKINREIKKATGDSGSVHRLRHNYAINTVKYFEGQGYSHIEAVHLTSLEMGHNRNEIIEGVYSK
jgi:site-specific recombinase XerD